LVDLNTLEEMEAELKVLCEKLANRLQKSNKLGRTIVLKIKFSDFSMLTRSKTGPYYFESLAVISKNAIEILHKVDFQEKKVRLLGVTVSNFLEETMDSKTNNQLRLF